MRTAQAAKYLRDRGVEISVSKMQKLRCRGPEDPRDKGPDFHRDPDTGVCDYDHAALDRYAAQRLAVRQFRAAAPQPANFRRTAS
jgi:hypothetical protein